MSEEKLDQAAAIAGTIAAHGYLANLEDEARVAHLVREGLGEINLCEGCVLWPCGNHAPLGSLEVITTKCPNRKPTTGQVIADLRAQLAEKQKYIDEHYSGAATAYIKELELELKLAEERAKQAGEVAAGGAQNLDDLRGLLECAADTQCGIALDYEEIEMLLGAWPSPASDVTELREALQDWEQFRDAFDALTYHAEGMGCGIEDRGITDRYAACEFGWDQAMKRVAEQMPESSAALLRSEPKGEGL